MNNELIFWQHWNACKGIYEGMEQALEKAKKNNPNADYSIAENKMKLMVELQEYVGVINEENTIVKRLNLEVHERYVRIKDLYLKALKENEALKKENENFKNNLTL